MLAATCSKIGQVPNYKVQPVQNPQCLSMGPGGGNVVATPTAIQLSTATGGATNHQLQLKGGVIQQLGGTNVVGAGGQMLPAVNSQIVATPVTGPGGTVTYNLIQQPQTVQTVPVQGNNTGQDQPVYVAVSQAPVLQLQSPPPAHTQNQMSNVVQNFVVNPTGQVIRMPAQNQVGGTANLTASIPVQNNTLQNASAVQVISQQDGTLQAIPVVQQAAPVQTIPVQTPIGTLNGQTIYQTLNIPIQVLQPTLQAAGALQLVQQQLGQQGVLNLSQQGVQCETPASNTTAVSVTSQGNNVSLTTVNSNSVRQVKSVKQEQIEGSVVKGNRARKYGVSDASSADTSSQNNNAVKATETPILNVPSVKNATVSQNMGKIINISWILLGQCKNLLEINFKDHCTCN